MPGVCAVVSFLSIVMASDMKCIGHDSSNRSMFVTTCPIPVLKAGEVLIKVRGRYTRLGSEEIQIVLPRNPMELMLILFPWNLA